MSKLSKLITAIVFTIMLFIGFIMLGIDIYSYLAGIVTSVMYWVIVSE